MKPTIRTEGKDGSGISRRGWFRRVAVALLAVPALRLGETVARAERRRRNHRGQAEDIWIGHC